LHDRIGRGLCGVPSIQHVAVETEGGAIDRPRTRVDGLRERLDGGAESGGVVRFLEDFTSTLQRDERCRLSADENRSQSLKICVGPQRALTIAGLPKHAGQANQRARTRGRVRRLMLERSIGRGGGAQIAPLEFLNLGIAQPWWSGWKIDGCLRLVQDAGTGGCAQARRQQANAVASSESVFRVLKLSFELECKAAGCDLEPFALALAFAVAVLLEHAQPEPDQRDDGHERRRAD
jgi:hypothetical protein